MAAEVRARGAAPPAILLAVLLGVLLAISVLPLGESELKFELLAALAAMAALGAVAIGALAVPAREVLVPGAVLYAWAALSLLWAPDRYRGVSAILWGMALAIPASLLLRVGWR